MEYNSKYRFNEKWFDHNIPLWDELFSKFNKPINNVLEIGCYEGRATVYLCEKVLEEGANYTVVDTFKGSVAESGMDTTMERLEKDNSIIEDNFMHNISFHDKINFKIHKGNSQVILPNLYSKLEDKFDLIFVDASHRADDTFVDGYFALKMLKKEGILIFDDFGWKDPAQKETVSSPEFGIRAFATMYNEEVDTIHTGYQVIFKKKKYKEFKV